MSSYDPVSPPSLPYRLCTVFSGAGREQRGEETLSIFLPIRTPVNKVNTLFYSKLSPIFNGLTLQRKFG